MRQAEYASLAAEAGVPLFGDESMIVASLRAEQCLALSNQSVDEEKRGPAGAAEVEKLMRRAWVVLLAYALPLLQCRLDKGTLLPGTLRKVEEAFDVYEHQLTCRVTEELAPSEDELRARAAGVQLRGGSARR